MKRAYFFAIIFTVIFAGRALGAEMLTLQLKWVTQGQFAGYYVANDKGYYSDEGLDVTIRPGGPNVAPPQIIAGGGADVIVEWMPAALAAREKGVPLVNIAQPFKRSGMMLTCRKDSGITTPADFPGKTFAISHFGNEYPFLVWMAREGFPTRGGPDGVTMMQKGYNVDPLLQGQADCIQTMSYNEYWQIIDAGIPAEGLVVFRYEDQGVAMLEDGLYVLEETLQDPEAVNRLARFVRASMRGWAYAQEHPIEAARIVIDHDGSGALKEELQIRMVREVNKLTKGSDGRLKKSDYERTVKTLLGSASDPVITKPPLGAYTSVVTDRM